MVDDNPVCTLCAGAVDNAMPPEAGGHWWARARVCGEPVRPASRGQSSQPACARSARRQPKNETNDTLIKAAVQSLCAPRALCGRREVDSRSVEPQHGV